MHEKNNPTISEEKIQEEVAEVCGLSCSTVSRVVNEAYRSPAEMKWFIHLGKRGLRTNLICPRQLLSVCCASW